MPRLEFASASAGSLFTIPDLNQPSWAKGPTIEQEIERKLTTYQQRRSKLAKATTTIRIQDAVKAVEIENGEIIAPFEEEDSGVEVVMDAPHMEEELTREAINLGDVVDVAPRTRSDRTHNGKRYEYMLDTHNQLNPANMTPAARQALIAIEQENETETIQYFASVVDRSEGLVIWRPKLVPIRMPSKDWVAQSGLSVVGESKGYKMPEPVSEEHENNVFYLQRDNSNAKRHDHTGVWYAAMGGLERQKSKAIKRILAALAEFIQDIAEIDQQIVELSEGKIDPFERRA